MTDRVTVENQISAVEKYLETLKRYQNYTAKEIKKNPDIRGAVERYLYLACQATIDLAESVIAYKQLRKPSSLSEAFSILNEVKIIPGELTDKLISRTGVRNILAHDYEDIDYDIIVDVLHQGATDMKQFTKIVGKKVL